MNIAKIMIPKVNIAFIYDKCTVRQGLEKMRFHNYTALPVIDSRGVYCGCVNEGNFLKHILKTNTVDLKEHEEYTISDIMTNERCKPLQIDSSIEELIKCALDQNFVPIVDSRNYLCGIVTRKNLILYLADALEDYAVKSELKAT